MRLARRPLDVWYAPEYRLPVTAVQGATGLEPRRSDYVAWWLVACGAVRASAIVRPERIGFEDLDRVHALDVVESLGSAEALARVFATDPSDIPVDELATTIRLACGGTLAAARAALAHRRAALNLQGGFHHAAPAAAGGFCAVNDVAVAIAALRAEGFRARVAVLDLDAHPPDGIAACLASDADAWIGSISGSDWGTLANVDETVLPEGTGDGEYLRAVAALLQRRPAAALTFVLAGGDVLAGDRFGRLALTLDGARRRDLAVAEALAGSASVWLPAGGYHRDAWRVLAGTGMVLAARSTAPIPDGYDPLLARYGGIARELSAENLGEVAFTEEDLEEALGLGARRPGQRLLLGYYTAAGLEHAFHRYGIFEYLRRVGYEAFRVTLDATGAGERMRVHARAGTAEHVVIELVLERRRVASEEVLYIHWLALRNPRARFSPARPALPGQDVPGLGIAREIGELLGLMARRLGLAGVAFRPAHFHIAFAARRAFRFVDAARQGRFEALQRDLAGLSLREATDAIDGGRVVRDGERYAWEAEEMVMWLAGREDGGRARAVEEERERVRFTVG
jgi:acetoin utilization deacetylase AcuC-like enzyme